MNTSKRRHNFRVVVYVFAVIGFSSMIYSSVSPLFTGKIVPSVSAQTDPFLDRRIGQIEQRFFSLESRLNRLEQDSRVQSITPVTPELPGSNNTEIYLLRSQIDTLQLRIAELECAAVKLDQRTLPETARRVQQPPASGIIDPCRRNVNTQLNLSAHP